jgi:hypothetical protein
VYRGNADVLKHDPTGEKKTTEIPGHDRSGKTSNPDRSPHPATARAGAGTVAFRIPPDAFGKRSGDKPHVSDRLPRRMVILPAMQQCGSEARWQNVQNGKKPPVWSMFTRATMGRHPLRNNSGTGNTCPGI